LKTYLRYQHIRKGGPGTLAQQYLAEPQPPFLFDFQKKRDDVFIQASYELINNFYITGSYQYLKQELASGAKASQNTMQIGITYGLK
jgi:predicted porin